MIHQEAAQWNTMLGPFIELSVYLFKIQKLFKCDVSVPFHTSIISPSQYSFPR